MPAQHQAPADEAREREKFERWAKANTPLKFGRDEEMGSTVGCKLCDEFNRANKAELELMTLRQTLRHRLRILKSRPIYEGAKKENGVSVELLQAMSLLFGVPGVLHPHEYEPAMVAEAEKALLTFENGRYIYSDQPGCNCYYPDKPHPAIHADTCPYRIQYSAAYGMKDHQ